jgi:hypothetical protein
VNNKGATTVVKRAGRSVDDAKLLPSRENDYYGVAVNAARAVGDHASDMASISGCRN